MCWITARSTPLRILRISKVCDLSDEPLCQLTLICIGTLSNELYRVTNIALLLEDTINGMMAANEFRGASDTPLPVSGNLLLQGPQSPAQIHHKSVEIIFEIENRNWDYKIQAGESRLVCS